MIMRILHIFDHVLFLDQDYCSRSLAIIREQRALGWETEQLIVHSDKPGADERDTLTLSDMEFNRLNCRGVLSNVPYLKYGKAFFETKSGLRRLIRQFKPDIMQVHTPAVVGLAALQVGQALDIPVVYELRSLWKDDFHNNDKPSGWDYQIKQKLETHVIRNANAVTTLCEGLRRTVIDLGVDEKKVCIIPNAGERIASSTKEKHGDNLKSRLGLEGKTLLGYIGGYYSHEGIHLILQSMPIMLQGFPEFHLLLIGEGPEEPSLKQLAAELGLSGQVTFLSREQNLAHYYDVIDIMIYPRLSTPLSELVPPVNPLQAMANACLVLASDIGGHKELIRHGENGYLFSKGDKNALADVLMEIIEERSAWPQLKKRGKAFIDKERNWTDSVAKYPGFYQTLINESD